MAVDYHGWTHLPKSQGGTDPVPFAGSYLPYCWMRWLGSEAVPADTISNPATVGTPDAPYEEAMIYDPDNLAGFQVNLNSGCVSFDAGLFYVWGSVEYNGTGSIGETIGAVLEQGSNCSFATNRVIATSVLDANNQNSQLPVDRMIFAIGTSNSVRIRTYHSDAGGNDIGAVWIHVVQLNPNVDGEFFVPS